MKLAADFRSIALRALKGKWLIAVVAGLVALLLGGIFNGSVSLPNFNFKLDSDLETLENAISSDSNFEMIMQLLIGTLISMLVILFIIFLVHTLIGSFVELGYSKFNLDLVDGNEPGIGDIFNYGYKWKTAVAARLLRSVLIFVWSLAFIFPGIVASYSYAMTGYILAENPDMRAKDALDASKKMMYGNRWRLFCLEISFIGWSILAALTCGIGELWLCAYRQAAIAAFYREVSGTEEKYDSSESSDLHDLMQRLRESENTDHTK